MSYHCDRHGWQHLIDMCPRCWNEQNVVTTSNTSEPPAVKANECRYCGELRETPTSAQRHEAVCSKAPDFKNDQILRDSQRTAANTANRDELAKKYDDSIPYDGTVDHKRAFKAGWEARDEEVRRLTERIIDLRTSLDINVACVEHNKNLVAELEADNKRLREALENLESTCLSNAQQQIINEGLRPLTLKDK